MVMNNNKKSVIAAVPSLLLSHKRYHISNHRHVKLGNSVRLTDNRVGCPDVEVLGTR